jgi:hypothetical protein
MLVVNPLSGLTVCVNVVMVHSGSSMGCLKPLRDYLVGTDENVLVLNRTYANRSNAERAAKMNWERG